MAGICLEISLRWMLLYPYWWDVNIGSGNGFVSPGKKKPLPEPILPRCMSTYVVNRPQWVNEKIIPTTRRSWFLKYDLQQWKISTIASSWTRIRYHTFSLTWMEDYKWSHLTCNGGIHLLLHKSGWRHQMETFAALLALCGGNLPVTSEFPTQRALMFSLICTLNKQLWGWWFEMPSPS